VAVRCRGGWSVLTSFSHIRTLPRRPRQGSFVLDPGSAGSQILCWMIGSRKVSNNRVSEGRLNRLGRIYLTLFSYSPCTHRPPPPRPRRMTDGGSCSMPLVGGNCSTRLEGSNSGAARQRPSRRRRPQQHSAVGRREIEPPEAKKRPSGAQIARF
jgi:hypothetical protein